MENQDKIFKDAAHKAEDKGFARMDAVWNRVEEKLDNKKQRTIAAWYKYTGIAAVFVLFMGIGFFMLTNEKNNPISVPKATQKNRVTVIDTQKVKETFDAPKAASKEAVVVTESVKSTHKEPAQGINKEIQGYGPVSETTQTTSETSPASEIAVTPISRNEEVSVSVPTGSMDKEKAAGDATAFAEIAKKQTPNSKNFSGVILDNLGFPVPGASVTVKGTNKVVQTDFDGKYMIDAKEGEKLIASYVGMESQQVTLGKRKDKIDFKLKDDVAILEEVVVMGYGTSSKKERRKAKKEEKETYINNTTTAYVAAPTRTYRGGNINNTDKIKVVPSTTNMSIANVPNSQAGTNVTSKTIEGRPNANFIQTLQGLVPGLQISTGSGQPGANSTVILRGYGSVSGANEPLIVVDGMPVSSDFFRRINPNHIESVNVIKDSGATAIYGSRGSNGVIIIKSKKEFSSKIKRQLKRFDKEQVKSGKEKPEQFQPVETPEPVNVNQEDYDSFVENQFENPATAPLSTFSIDVDNASYTNVRRFINNGKTVPKDAVRVEEMINFFKYQYPQPTGSEPFSINTEYSDAPWNPEHKLLKIGLQGKIIPDDNLPTSNFVFLIDVSGSMNEENKLPLLKESMRLLVEQMRSKDKIAIVVYAGAAGMVLPPTNGSDKQTIYNALDKLSAGGSTAGGAGIELAYKTAQENFIKGGNNRVILATDGDFNVGASSDKDMQTLIEEKRKSGVFLTCLGYGMANYKDSKMEILADKGNGNYAYIDNMQEANRYLTKEFKGSMYTIAKDVKIQIEFNPKHVQSYRLIGYENRKLRDEDFANDAIDAGELGSGHTVTALYEIIPVGIKSDLFTPTADLKYSQSTGNINQYNDELATIKFRSKKLDEDVSTEIVKVIPNTPMSLQNTSGDFKFAASVAWFGLKLRDSQLISNKKTNDIQALAKQGLQNDPEGYRSEFVRLVDMVKY